jgi:hypothetical protein
MSMFKFISFYFLWFILRCCEYLYNVEWLSDEWMMSWKDLERGGRDVIRWCPGICLDGLTEDTRILTHDCLPSGRNTNLKCYRQTTLFNSSLMMYQTERRHIPEYTDIQPEICCYIYFFIYLSFVTLTVVLRLRSFGIWRLVVWYIGTNVSEEPLHHNTRRHTCFEKNKMSRGI